MQSCERAAIAFSPRGRQRIDGSDRRCLEYAAKSQSTLLGAAKALQPFGCFDGFAFQFVSRKNAGGFWPQVKTAHLVLPDLASMGGLNTSLLISTQALETAQGAITATSNNIANANTPGYTREVPQFTESPLSQTGSTVIGGGVSLTGLQSVRDELLNLQIQNQTSLQSSADTQSSLPAADSDQLHDDGRRHNERAFRILEQPGPVIRESIEFGSPAGSDFERAEPGEGLQHNGEWADKRAVGCRHASDADCGADQLADCADCATQRAGRSTDGGRKRWGHRGGPARRIGVSSFRS